MGWLFLSECGNASDVRDHLLRGFGDATVVDHKMMGFGRRWWALVEDANGRWIFLALIQSGGTDGWGYKDIAETWGPNYYDCPLSLLDKATPTDNKHARTWRAQVREYHAARAKAPKVTDFEEGQRVTLYGKAYTLWSRSRRSWLAHMKGAGNAVYRIGPKHFAHMKVDAC